MAGFIEKVKNIFTTKEISEITSDIKKVIIPEEPKPEVENLTTSNMWGTFQYSLDFNSTSSTIIYLIKEYRLIAQYPEVDEAIAEIVNEAIVQDGSDIVQLVIEEEKIKENIKEKIIDEFNNLTALMNFNNDGDSLFRQWYEDGRMYLHGEVDLERPKNGIQNVKVLNPFNLKQIKENGELFFIYDDKKADHALKIPEDHITFIHSTISDPSKKYYVSHLHKAIKPYNQLKLLEDAAIIYRITRAPERRVFYVDVGQMNKSKAEAYMTNLMNKFKNKITYDSFTGKVDQQKNVMTMVEDFWMPAASGSEGSRGTRVETLQGGTQLGEITDITYFNKKLKKSLNVPFSRFDTENRSQLGFGTMNGEMSRDEVRFSKFVNKLRYNFAQCFYDLLKKQLILKNIITINDWKIIKPNLKFIWNVDSYYAEVKDAEILKNRIDIATTIDPFKNKYFSNDYIMKKIFRMSEEEIKAERELIETEAEDEIYNPPAPENEDY